MRMPLAIDRAPPWVPVIFFPSRREAIGPIIRFHADVVDPEAAGSHPRPGTIASPNLIRSCKRKDPKIKTGPPARRREVSRASGASVDALRGREGERM